MKRALLVLTLAFALSAGAAMAQAPPPDDTPLPPALPGSDAPLPGGSYARSCSDISFWNGILRATCRGVDMDGGPTVEQAFLNYNYCPVKDRVTNYRGTLICADPRDMIAPGRLAMPPG